MQGYGEYVWGDGRKYEGEYQHDKKHGFGKYTWADGRAYVGYWFMGKQEGLGKYILLNSTYSLGMWQRGKRNKWLSENEIEIYKEDDKFQRIINFD